LSPRDHLVMQAAIQKYVDSSISKTINVPEGISFEDFKGIYTEAYELGCKGCTTYRPNDITGSVLETNDKSKSAEALAQPELPLGKPSSMNAKPKDAYDGQNVVALTQPLARPDVLQGATYKLQWPESDHALYITVTDILQDGRRRPFEMFINSKNTEHYAWTVALTRMISAVFRRGGDVSFVVEELKAVFDPRGGQWMRGKYVPSLLAAIGEVLEQHMIAIGFLPAPDRAAEREILRQPQVVNLGASNIASPGGHDTDHDAHAPHKSDVRADARFRQCPKCGQASLIRQEGCDTCTNCGHSKCG
ncbi:MAG: ribonucleoside-diphosphate reductase, adenosylcobalamin-dependent, partial [Rhodospirillales bacterium]|nr:ribonucleoside-diphosphate reductase, adenosylcobalamin-dependent [Rhodospirillales bacterium]